MKKLLLHGLLFLSFTIQSQTYDLSLDSTFGNGGTKVLDASNNPSLEFVPKRGLLINGNYFFISNAFSSNSKITKFNYNGDLDTTFGINGFITMGNSTNEYTIISDFKFINNAIYMFGEIVNGTSKDGFIAKMNENGVFDTGFGINGISRLDFGANEIIRNFCIDANGNLYCTGRKITGTTASTNRMIHFKLNPDGSLNNSFDSNGYKEFLINNYTEGTGIFADGNDFLLVGTATQSGSTIYQRLLIVKVNTNGEIITSFGTNGSTVVDLYGGMSITINDLVLASNKLYINYYYAWSFNTQGSQIMKYDLSNSQIIFNRATFYQVNFQVENTDDLYAVGSDRCTLGPCNRKFKLRKLLADGTSDSYYGTNGLYEYDFPNTNPGDDTSRVLIKESNGKTLLAGYVDRRYLAGNQQMYERGFAMLRLVQGPLGVTDNFKNDAKIYPNPCREFVNVETEQPVNQIDLIDINGRILNTLSVNDENTIQVNIPNLDTGLYFIKLTMNDGNVITEKIIKQ